MSGPATLLVLAAAGGLGAATRFVLDGVARAVLPSRLPWPTMAINVTGSLLLGLLTGALTSSAGADALLVLGTGFCGGYTTFSTASLESVRLVQQGHHLLAAVNAVLTPVLAVGAAATGLLLTA